MPNKDFSAWQNARQQELSAPDSWLGLIGLFWLEAGANSVGSAPEATVCLPSGPEHLGDLHWENGQVFWRPVHGDPVMLATDLHGKPTTVDHENLSFFIVDRDGRLAARLRDRDWALLQPFAGLDYFDFDPAWQIKAKWQRLEPSRWMEVPNVSGDLKSVEVTHQAAFTHAGQTVNLLPVSVSENEIFFVFRDRSSGKETYGAGRFLKVSAAPPVDFLNAAVDLEITLDFNRAYNPPCAFTPFATCPLPPPENWLPFAVPVGEKRPASRTG